MSKKDGMVHSIGEMSDAIRNFKRKPAPSKPEPKKAEDRKANWVSMVQVKPTRNAPYELAVGLFAEVGSYDAIKIVLLDGTPLETVWDYRLVSERGAFVIPNVTTD